MLCHVLSSHSCDMSWLTPVLSSSVCWCWLDRSRPVKCLRCHRLIQVDRRRHWLLVRLWQRKVGRDLTISATHVSWTASYKCCPTLWNCVSTSSVCEFTLLYASQTLIDTWWWHCLAVVNPALTDVCTSSACCRWWLWEAHQHSQPSRHERCAGHCVCSANHCSLEWNVSVFSTDKNQGKQ